MTPTMNALLDARTNLDRAVAAHQNAVEQLAICTERWLEKTPDRIRLDTYRTTLDARHAAGRAVTLAERAAVAAGDLCAECLHLASSGCDCGERPVVHSAVRESNDWVASTMRSIGLGGGVL